MASPLLHSTFRILAFLALIPLVFTFCAKEEPVTRLPGLEIPEITGYYLRDQNGYTMGTIGNPNVQPGNGPSLAESDHYFMIYPNPATHYLYLYSKSTAANSVRRIWMVAAATGSSAPGYSEAFNSINLVAGGTPLISHTSTSDNIVLDISSLEPGYYRVYLENDGLLFYDNLVVAAPSSEPQKSNN